MLSYVYKLYAGSFASFWSLPFRQGLFYSLRLEMKNIPSSSFSVELSSDLNIICGVPGWSSQL